MKIHSKIDLPTNKKIQNFYNEIEASMLDCGKENKNLREEKRGTQSSNNHQNDESDETDVNTASFLNRFQQFDAASPIFISGNHLLFESFQKFRKIAMDAAKAKKIFTIYGSYRTLRKELLNRGWIEKMTERRFAHNMSSLPVEYIVSHATRANHYGSTLLSYFLQNSYPNFVWQPRSVTIRNNSSLLPYRNRFMHRTFDICSKEGLKLCIDMAKWYTIENVAETQTPRCYRMRCTNDCSEFLQDYRTTCCLNFVKFICDNNDPKSLFHPSGEIPMETLKFAITRLNDEIECSKGDTLVTIAEQNITRGHSAREWRLLFEHVKHLIWRKCLIHSKNPCEIDHVLNNCRTVYSKCVQVWPKMKSDGHRNLWIMKPGFTSQGFGIVIKNSFEDIMHFAKCREHMHYVVQKYIERPLLIYKTKFDIRQYSMITITKNRVNIWKYEDCYLKFSSQEFNLINLNESVHLTNHSVQKRYKNGTRDYRLPKNNMWRLKDFLSYLTKIRKEFIWDKKISPGINKNLISILLTSISDVQLLQNSFEFYGCDFLLDESFEPMIIEFNSQPDMASTTEVTASICPAVLLDALKVVLDWSVDNSACTGNFKLIYSTHYDSNLRNDGGLDLQVVGTKMNIYEKDGKIHTENYMDAIFRKQLRSRLMRKSVSKEEVIESIVPLHESNDDAKLVTVLKPETLCKQMSVIEQNINHLIERPKKMIDRKKSIKKTKTKKNTTIKLSQSTINANMTDAYKSNLRETLDKIKACDDNKEKILHLYTKNVVVPQDLYTNSNRNTINSLMKESLNLNSNLRS